MAQVVLVVGDLHENRLGAHGGSVGRGDHGQLKARLRPMPGLKQVRSARGSSSGMRSSRTSGRGHDELTVEEPVSRRWWSRSTNWPWRSDPERSSPFSMSCVAQRNTAPVERRWRCRRHFPWSNTERKLPLWKSGDPSINQCIWRIRLNPLRTFEKR